VAEHEMLRTFNCGIGMIVIVDGARADEAISALKDAGETPVRLGQVQTHQTGDRVTYSGKLAL
jgi:phosphoribosylformylglycinamidine cyclo-ligase